MFKAITFDFWNTLYQAAPYAFALRRKFLFEIFAKNHVDVSVEQVDDAEDVARTEWNRAWREEYRTPPAADWVRWMLDELLIQLPSGDFNALADYFDRSLLEANPGPKLIDGAPARPRRPSPCCCPARSPTRAPARSPTRAPRWRWVPRSAGTSRRAAPP